jgi:hypothetical protein
VSASTKRLLQLLEARYGVSREVARHLAPVLERVAEQQLSSEDLEALLGGIAAAYRSSRPPEPELAHEVKALVGDFVSEVRKIEESLKVVGVYLDRIRQRLVVPLPSSTLH